MMRLSRSNLKKDGGFTLVELAIALTVIGLLLAGLLKSVELIENGRVGTFVAQTGHYESAISAFRSLYKALPGDMHDPARLSACSGFCAGGGNGDGMIFSSNGADFTGSSNSESHRVWVHLSRAGLINTVDPTYTTSQTSKAGLDYAPVVFDGGVFDLHYNRLAFSSSRPLPEVGHYLKTRNLPMSNTSNNLLTYQQAQKIDAKMDDGRPVSGRVVAWRFVSGAVQACGTLADNEYNLTNRNTRCDVSIRMNF